MSSMDIPDAFLPEFPAPVFLTSRPDLGDVSKGQEITNENFYELFDGILAPVQFEEKLFFGKARCADCHQPPFYTDNLMHDLRVERFYKGRAEGAIKTFPLRGIKDSPPYLHDGRLLTLEDAVEFFNIVTRVQPSAEERKDLAAFLRAL